MALMSYRFSQRDTAIEQTTKVLVSQGQSDPMIGAISVSGLFSWSGPASTLRWLLDQDICPIDVNMRTLSGQKLYHSLVRSIPALWSKERAEEISTIRDCVANTVLHTATAELPERYSDRHAHLAGDTNSSLCHRLNARTPHLKEAITFLLEKRLDVHAQNAYKLTPLGVLLQESHQLLVHEHGRFSFERGVNRQLIEDELPAINQRVLSLLQWWFDALKSADFDLETYLNTEKLLWRNDPPSLARAKGQNISARELYRYDFEERKLIFPSVEECEESLHFIQRQMLDWERESWNKENDDDDSVLQSMVMTDEDDDPLNSRESERRIPGAWV